MAIELIDTLAPKFQSTLSVRRAARTQSEAARWVREFQSTLSVRRAAGAGNTYTVAAKISIHALREESGTSTGSTTPSADLFQSTLSVRRAACTVFWTCLLVFVFQSTLSVRRAARRRAPQGRAAPAHFNPRSP